MDYRHEIINFGERIPVRCFIHQLGHSGRHWHDSLELLFVLSGEVSIIVDAEHYMLEPEDVILINSNSPHELTADSAIMVAVQIKLSLFDDSFIPAGPLYFECNSKTSHDAEGILQIKRIVAQFVKAHSSTDEGRLFRAKALSYALMAELMARFRMERNALRQEQAMQQNERIARMADYIAAHYRENITLQQIAEREYLSVPYASRFFTRMMGMGFSAYLNHVRLTQAVSDLLATDDTIVHIAGNNGFANTQAFVQLFKKQYDMLPRQYRKQKYAKAKAAPVQAGNQYEILDTTQYLKYFADFLDSAPQERVFDDSELPDIECRYRVDGGAKGMPIRHTWRSYTTVSSAKELLQADVQRMLADLQRQIGFTYVKFHGILSDDMHVCERGRDGSVEYSFVYVDKALDFLRSVGLKPLIQLGFMPKAIAEFPERRIFGTTMINSRPKNMAAWLDLVDAFVRHLIDRYGLDTVRQWPFTVWNEPDTPVSMFGFDSDDDFFAFYCETWRRVKRIAPEIVIGTPSIYYYKGGWTKWMRRFNACCESYGCTPDFVLIHFYGTVLYEDRGIYDRKDVTVTHLKLTNDEDMLAGCIQDVHESVREVYGRELPVYLTEWNFSPSHRELLGDTCFRSCYMVKNILENIDRLESMGYWVLTDLFEEHQVPDALFHGGLGLLTYNGVPKAAWHALVLLGKLGDTLLGRGEGWFLTRRGGDYQLMLYNYRHYSALYADCEAFDMTQTERYTPFGSQQRRDFEICIENASEGDWLVKEYAVSRSAGSAFDKWVEMGAQPLGCLEDVELLKGLSQPMMNQYILHSGRDGLSINALLDMLEIRLILLKRI